MRLATPILFAAALCSASGCGSGSGSGPEGDPPVAPTAIIGASTTTGSKPLTVAFDGTGSFAAAGGVVTSYHWDFGDGAQSIDASPLHAFTAAGSYGVRLAVTDSQGLRGEDSLTIAVTDSPGAPLALLAASAYSGLTPLAVSFDSSGSHDLDGAITAYHWSFGDGATATAPSPSHNFSAGVYTVILTVTDDSGSTGQDQTVVAVASYDDELVRLVNAERWSYLSSHLPPLKAESHLAAAALRHSTDMAANMGGSLSHVGTDGSTFDQRIRDAGYTSGTALGENIAAGYATPSAVMTGWMGSSGHRANIMSASYREIGVSHVYAGTSAFRHYWTQDFGARTSVYPVVIDREAFATANAAVSLHIHGSGWATEMQVSNAADFPGAVWEPYVQDKAWTLPSGLGAKTVHVKLRRGATEITCSDSIVRVEG